MPNFMKIRPVGTELFYSDGQTHTDGRSDGWTDGRTDSQTMMTKPIAAFRNFANEPKKLFCALNKC